MAGLPSLIHPLMNDNRLHKSSIHEANGINEGYATASQFFGTKLSNNELPIVSNSVVITISPFIAFCNDTNDDFMTCNSLLYRIASCTNTVFIDSSYVVGYCFINASILMIAGQRDKI